MGKIIAVIVVALIIIAGGAFFFMNHSSYAPQASPSPSSSSSMSNMPMNSSSPSASTTAQATNSVSIANFAFSPSAITVKKGTTVTWTNNDSTTHTVTETDGQNGPSSGNLTPGKSYTFTYGSTGTFKYNCSIHPSMTGTVTVTD